MAYLHANRVIHRSLKSKNILCDRDNNLKIRDFGLHPVKDFVDSIETSANPEYQAPELLARQTIDDRIDVYSFSMVLVECVQSFLICYSFGLG
jgi:serine/threonine protein kinase